MAQCVAATKRGSRCLIDAVPGIKFCHLHNPAGAYRKRHPVARAKVVPITLKKDERKRQKQQERKWKQEQKQVEEAKIPTAARGGLRVYTDGGCWPNPGVGGWGWVVEGDLGSYGSGFDPSTTNQRMELQAAADAVENIEGPLIIVSDSRYLVDCFRDGWWIKWLKNDWRRQEHGEWFDVKNRDLWEPLVALVVARGNVGFEWVKGHAGNEWNERADELASAAVRGLITSSR